MRHALTAVAQALGVPAAGASTSTPSALALSTVAAALAAYIGGAAPLTSIERLGVSDRRKSNRYR